MYLNDSRLKKQKFQKNLQHLEFLRSQAKENILKEANKKGMSKLEQKFIGSGNPMIPGLVQNQDSILSRKYIDNALQDIKVKPKLGKSSQELGMGYYYSKFIYIREDLSALAIQNGSLNRQRPDKKIVQNGRWNYGVSHR